MKVQVLGPGCGSCKQLHEQTLQAIKELDLQIEVEYTTDMTKIIEMGIMSVPALVIDGVVVSSGKALSANDIKEFLSGKKKSVASKVGDAVKGAISCACDNK